MKLALGFVICLLLAGCAGSPLRVNGASQDELKNPAITNASLISALTYDIAYGWTDSEGDDEVKAEVLRRGIMTQEQLDRATGSNGAVHGIRVRDPIAVALVFCGNPSAINSYGRGSERQFAWNRHTPLARRSLYIYTDSQGRITNWQTMD